MTGSLAKNHKESPLTFDISFEILVRLSVKTLSRFRSVCKLWDCLISDPLFQRDHYRRRQQKPLFLHAQRGDGCYHICTYNNIKEGSNNINKFSIMDPPGQKVYCNFKIQYCLGLACIPPVWEPIESRAILFNPTTEERIALPSIPIQARYICFGFGYAASLNEFKVVNFYNHGNRICCNVFTLGTDEDWREANAPPLKTPPVCVGVAPFLQGALHTLHGGNNKYSINIFNLESEEYKLISVTEHYRTRKYAVGALSDLGGALCLVGYRDNFMELWLLKDYNKVEWFNEYKIDMFLACSSSFRNPTLAYCATPLEISGDGSITFALRGWWTNELMCYNPQNKILTRRMNMGLGSWGIFVENFPPPGKPLKSRDITVRSQ